jgi:DNA-binding response OmpR family regulator
VRILIVEDDERIVSFMKRGLEAEEFDVDIASGKSQTCDLVTTRHYDLIIIDIFLGPDDGLDLCHSLRQRRVGSPILIMTAKGTPETEKASKEAGADAYLAKPFAFEDLIGTIARLRTAYSCEVIRIFRIVSEVFT